MVPPRKANSLRPGAGSRSRWRWKSPTTPVTVRPGYSSARASAASRRVASLTSSGTNRLELPRGLHGVEEDPRLLAGAGPDLHQHVRLGVQHHLLCVRVEDRALRTGRVVLGEAGDLVEEPAAALVVEIDRRELFRFRGEPGTNVVLQRAPKIRTGEVHLDGRGDHGVHGRGHPDISPGPSSSAGEPAPAGTLTSRGPSADR